MIDLLSTRCAHCLGKTFDLGLQFSTRMGLLPEGHTSRSRWAWRRACRPSGRSQRCCWYLRDRRVPGVPSASDKTFVWFLLWSYTVKHIYTFETFKKQNKNSWVTRLNPVTWRHLTESSSMNITHQNSSTVTQGKGKGLQRPHTVYDSVSSCCRLSLLFSSLLPFLRLAPHPLLSTADVLGNCPRMLTSTQCIYNDH